MVRASCGTVSSRRLRVPTIPGPDLISNLAPRVPATRPETPAELPESAATSLRFPAPSTLPQVTVKVNAWVVGAVIPLSARTVRG